MNFGFKENLLISYFVENFIPKWKEIQFDWRYQISFTYLLYVSNLITSDQLIQIMNKFPILLEEETNILIWAFENPSNLIEETKYYWTKKEKLLILVCYIKFNDQLTNVLPFLPKRTLKGCKNELSRIIWSAKGNGDILEKLFWDNEGEEIDKNVNENEEELHENEEELHENEEELYENEEKIENECENIEIYVSFEQSNDKNYVSRQFLANERLKHKSEMNELKLFFARKIKNIQNCHEVSENIQDEFHFNNEFDEILLNSVNNFGLGTRKRYSSSAKSFWIALRTFSRKAYYLMKEYLDGPWESSVDEWIKNNSEIPKCNDLENIANISKIIDFWVNKLEITKDKHFTISIDAAKIDENLCIDYNGNVSGTTQHINLPHKPNEYRNNPELYRQLWYHLLKQKLLVTHIFIILLCPISSQRAFPLFVKFTKSGSATDDVQHDLGQIVEQCSTKGLKIRFIGCDSDPCYRQKFNIQFKYIMNLWENDLINISRIPENCVLYSNDAYHCLKRLRKSMINSNGLYMKPNDVGGNFCVNQNTLQTIDKSLPDCIFKKGSMTSMDDYYPSALFTWKTLEKCKKSGNYAAIFYIWIGVIARNVMACKRLNRAQRCTLCYLGLFMVLYYKMLLDKWRLENIPEKILSLMIMNQDLCVDFINFFSSMIKALTSIENPFPLSRIGSILSEHYFGRIRGNASSNQTINAIRSTITKLQIVDAYRKDINFNEKNHRRKLDSAIVEAGKIVLDEINIIKCRDFAKSLLYQSGIFLNSSIPPNLLGLSQQIYRNIREIESEFFETHSAETKKSNDEKKRWILNAAQFRVNGRYGRNIMTRYATSAK